MFHELKVYQSGFLSEPDKIEVNRFRVIPVKTLLVFSKKQSLKNQVWQNARKKGWLSN